MHQNRTTAEVVFEALKHDVISGYFQGGDRLIERDLTARYQVSRTPLRQALQELVRSGLAVAIAYRGVFVREISPSFARDVYELRANLDAMAGFYAAKRASDAELQELRKIADEVSFVSDVEDGPVSDIALIDEILALNAEFHKGIALASGNALLVEKLEELWTSINLMRYRSWRSGERAKNSRDEHLAIMRALEARNAELASNLCKLHALEAWSFVRQFDEQEASNNINPVSKD